VVAVRALANYVKAVEEILRSSTHFLDGIVGVSVTEVTAHKHRGYAALGAGEPIGTALTEEVGVYALLAIVAMLARVEEFTIQAAFWTFNAQRPNEDCALCVILCCFAVTQEKNPALATWAADDE